MDQERTDYADPDSPTPLPPSDVVRRLRVVVPGFLVGLFLSICCGLPVATNPAFVAAQPLPGAPPKWVSAALVFFGPAAGPFAEPLAFADYSPVRMSVIGAVLLACIGAHPYRPNWGTGLFSTAALAVWFFIGLGYTYAGV